jgi:glyoxylase-like metal-dependent hydrolase (beta-lactamase superfamily II)/rhodanese-related sulfurtransferase
MDNGKITVAELQKMFEEGKQFNVLDVRPEDQRAEWKIAGSVYQNAYEGLREGSQNILDHIDLPKTLPVVTVCAAGITAAKATAILNEKGYMAFTLEGGMRAWNYAWNMAEIEDGKLTIIQVRRVAKGCLSYVIGSGNEAIVVDASLDPEVYHGIAARHNWRIKYVLDTHIHADYISRTIELAKATNAIHLFSENAEVAYDFTPLSDGDIVPFGNANLTVVFTPGHTSESISYLVNDKYLLTGDTLFTNGVGRPDLKADSEQAMQKAAQLFTSLGKILSLSKEDLLILPAHTSSTVAFDGKILGDKLSRLSAEVELLSLQKKEFIGQTIARIPPTPSNYLQIAAINKKGDYHGINPADLEAGANRCTVS